MKEKTRNTEKSLHRAFSRALSFALSMAMVLMMVLEVLPGFHRLELRGHFLVRCRKIRE